MTPRALVWVSSWLAMGLACANPSSERHRYATSGEPDSLGEGGEEQLDPAEIAAGPTSCEPSTPRTVRYGSTVSAQLRPELAKLRCIDDVSPILEGEVACANAFNEASWKRAYAEAGLELLAGAVLQAPYQVDVPAGSLELGARYPNPNERRQNLVFLGSPPYQGCSGTTSHTPTGPGIRLARTASGQIVTAIPAPQVEARNYVNCSCFPGCGMMPETEMSFGVLDAAADYGGTVEVEYSAIAVSIASVESESCCCVP